MHFQDFWDSCAQNKTSEISKNALSGFLGLLCAEQNVGNLKSWTFKNSGIPVRRTRRRQSQKNALSGIMGLLCAEQNVGNLENYTLRNYGTTVRKRKRRKSQKMHFRNFWDSCAQSKTQEISTMRFQNISDSCAQNIIWEISKSALSELLGLWLAASNAGNPQKSKILDLFSLY